VRFRRIKSQPESDVAEKVEPLNEAESEWVAANVAEAKRMLDGRLSPEALDDLWAALLDDEPADPNPPIRTPPSTWLGSRSVSSSPTASTSRGSL